MNNCKHTSTKIWEPHLAGARKCLDCGWVYNPNRFYVNKLVWFDEELEKERKEKAEYERLKEKYG